MNWDKIRRITTKTDFINNIVNFNIEIQEVELIKRIKNEYLNKPEFNLQVNFY